MTKPQNVVALAAARYAGEMNDRATERDMYEIGNKSRTFNQDQLDEILALAQEQGLDDSDLEGFSAWGPADLVYRSPGVESWVDLIGGSESEADEDEEMVDEDEEPPHVQDQHEIAWWRYVRDEKKRRDAARAHKLAAAPAKIVFNAVILPEDKTCHCKLEGKKHAHYSCTTCGGFVTAKVMGKESKLLDPARGILCETCYAANKKQAAA